MAKFKAAKGKPKTAGAWGAVPCLIVLITGMLLITLLFYFILKSQ